MSQSGITLGHFLIAMAAVELVVIPLMARSVLRSNAGAEAGQSRRAVGLVVAAAIVSAIGLCLLGLYWPQAQMILF